MTSEEIIKWAGRYASAEIEEGDAYWPAIKVDGEDYHIASWIADSHDAIAIKFGLHMFALAIRDRATAEQKIETLADKIFEAAKISPWHGDGLSQEAINRPGLSQHERNE